MTRVVPVALLLAALTVAACNNNSSTSTTAPTAAPPSTTEIFAGTVPFLADTHNGGDFHTFVVGQAGEVDITLTAAAPPSTIQMGWGVGTPSGTTCPHTFGAVTTAAGPNIQGFATLNAGTYCIDVFDVGNMAQAVTYSITVAHP